MGEQLLEGVIGFVGWVLLALGAFFPVGAFVLLIVSAILGIAPWWLPLVQLVGGAVIAFFTLAGAGDSLIEQGVITFILLVLGLSTSGSASRIIAKVHLEADPDLAVVCMIVILGLALTPAVFFLPVQLSDLKKRSG